MSVDWSKPLETTPCSRNPKPVPCELEHTCDHGGARVRICGGWFDVDGSNEGNCSWFFDSNGKSILDGTVRNRVEATVVDWSKPLELEDGTPVVPACEDRYFPDGDGDYRLAREDDEFFTEAQIGGTGIRVGSWNADGSRWSNAIGGLRVRNRVEATVVDWTKPIEAVEKATGRVVPMEFMCAENDIWYTKSTPKSTNGNNCWYEDGRDWCSHNAWYIRNVENVETKQSEIPYVGVTVTGMPIPDGFKDVMKHTIVGADIAGILITANDSMTITNGAGVKFVFQITNTEY